MIDGKEVRERVKQAWLDKRVYERQLREIYEYVMPYRDPAGLHGLAHQTAAENRTDRIFDNTAMTAAFRFAGNMQNDLTPVFQPFFELAAGPLLPDDDAKKQLTEDLQSVSRTVNGVFSSGSFHMRAHEMFLDLFAGTGAMLVMPGDDIDIVRFRTVPIPEIALEDGPYGDIWGVDWRRKYRLGDLQVLWPDARLSAQMKKKIADKPRDMTAVHQYSRYDAGARRWALHVWSEDEPEDLMLHTEEMRTSPWLTPRFFAVPGEPYGRGPAHLALPNIKTTNKVRELALLAAAFAVMGLWMRRHDGVFNPDMATFKPLAMWPVSSTGGPLGATIQRLPVPQDFDVSSFVIADEREQMKQALLDGALPPEAGAVRSATEIAERMKRLNQDRGGVLGRLTLEIVKPLVQRTIDILEQRGMLSTRLTIDQLLTQVRVIAPIAATQQASNVQGAVNWMQMMTMLGGGQAAMLAARIETLFPEMGRWLGVDERFIRSDAESKQLQQMMGAIMAAGQEPPAPEPEADSQAIVNGGGL